MVILPAAFVISILTFPLSALRISGLTWFDLSMATLLICFLYKTKLRLFLPRDALITIVSFIVLMISATSASLLITENQAEHFRKSLILIGTFSIMWLFWFQAAYLLNQIHHDISRLLLCACSLLSVSVIFHGVNGPTGAENVLNYRAVGWAEHPIEAGYICAYGTVLSVYFINKKINFVSLALLTINLLGLRYAASLTAILGTFAGIIIFLIITRNKRLFGLIILSATLGVFFATDLKSLYVIDKLFNVLNNGTDYNTVSSRVVQIKVALEHVDGRSLFIGHGYSNSEKIMDMDIHNGFIANLHHFGILAVLANMSVFLFLVRNLIKTSSNTYQTALFAALIVVFLSVYISGPTLSRRSLWSPLIAMSAMISMRTSRNREVTEYNFSQLPFVSKRLETAQ